MKWPHLDDPPIFSRGGWGEAWAAQGDDVGEAVNGLAQTEGDNYYAAIFIASIIRIFSNAAVFAVNVEMN